LASDMIGFAMSMTALNMSIKPASKELTFGWYRAEIIGTLSSIIFLLVLTIGLVFAAIGRVYSPQEVKGKEMAITAVAGLFFNLIQMRILGGGDGDHGHGHSHDLGGGHDSSDDSHSDEGIDGKNVNV
jgi:zinc transporter 2